MLRISLQGWDVDLVDEQDRQERMRTRYVLQDGLVVLLGAMLRTMLTHPARFFAALVLAIRIGRGAERPMPYHLAYLAEACRIVPWLKSFGATHLHAHFGNNSAEVSMLAHVLGGLPYSFTVHGQDELYFGGIAEKVRRAKFVVAISSYGRSQLYYRVNPTQWPKLKVVHCGLDPAFYNVSPLPFPEKKRLVCVGRLSIEKGQLLLVQAAYQLAGKNIEFELILAGDGEMRPELEDLIARYGLAGQVRITGWLTGSQVREEILAARGLIVPSFTEGLPVVLMEAMALHRPVMAIYVGGIPELVKQGENGWLFPAGDVDALAAAMEDCLSKSPNELQKMGDAGYHRVLGRHSIDAEVVKLAELFP